MPLFEHTIPRAEAVLRDQIGKQQGMALVDQNANPEWVDAALEALHLACRECELVTTDDVVDRMDPIYDTPNWKALGPSVMKRGAAAGWMRKAYKPGKPCETGRRHGAPLADTLAAQVSERDLAAGILFPRVAELRRITAKVAEAVVRQAGADGVARNPTDDAAEVVATAMWDPVYPAIDVV